MKTIAQPVMGFGGLEFDMEVKSVFDADFSLYGQTLEGYDFSELFQAVSAFPIPEQGVCYVPGVPELESCRVFDELRCRGFGGMPIQAGYCNGVNDRLNCMEYHKSSEFNIAVDNIVLLLGLKYDIEDGMFDSSKVKAFCIPAGTGVELYGTTLHYAPCGYDGNGFRMICILPKGTNIGKEEVKDAHIIETKMYLCTNKWLMVHPESEEAKNGSYIGIRGENLIYRK